MEEGGVMPALNVVFTEEEMALVREAAAQEGTSMKSLAHETVLTELRRRKVRAAALRTARISAGLNKRLSEK
jgi:hypothetical protein